MPDTGGTFEQLAAWEVDMDTLSYEYGIIFDKLKAQKDAAENRSKRTGGGTTRLTFDDLT